MEIKFSSLKDQLRNLPEIEKKYAALSRDVNEYKNLYSTLTKRKEEDKLNALTNINPVQIEVLNPPLVPVEPIRPNIQYNFVIALVIALFVSMGSAFLLELSDSTVKNAEFLEKSTGIPVLTEVQFQNKDRFY